MGKLTIGQMAKLNCVSEKALRIYHNQGLLVPQYINEQTGYRYYSIHQSATLDMIRQMEELGFSLKTIKKILDTSDIAFLQDIIKMHIAKLQEKYQLLRAVEKTLMHTMEQCQLCQNKPDCMNITIEDFPARRKLCFDIDSYYAGKKSDSSFTALELWEYNLRKVKQQFLTRGLPLFLFQNIGCTVSKQDLLAHRIRISEAFVFLNDNMDIAHDSTVPAGKFVCKYCDGITGPDGSYKEETIIHEMLDYIKEYDLTIIGDYHGEVLAETPAFHYTDREMFFKLQIPIASSEH